MKNHIQIRAIKIKSSIKLSDIDSLYLELYGGIVSKERISLILPKKIEKYSFSIVPSLIQFVATWQRFSLTHKLLLDLEIDNYKDIESLYDQEYVFPAIALIWNTIPIENFKGQDLMPILRNPQNEFVKLMREKKGMKGTKLLFVNLDHFGQAGLLPYFEPNGIFNTNEIDLSKNLKEVILRKVLLHNQENQNEFKSIYEDVIGVIFELMKNTYEWARKDEFNKPFSHNLRGLYIRYYMLDHMLISKEYSNSIALKEYYSSTQIEKNRVNKSYFIEISVFDCGSGFVKKFHSEMKSTLSDIEIIKKCLTKNQTSAIGDFKSVKGIGLDRILNILNRKGFLRIKTDKYTLYRNLIKSPYIERSDNIELFDWSTNTKNIYTEKQMCVGSSLSILYPLPQSFTKYE